MPQIDIGTLVFGDVVRGDALDVAFNLVTDLDLTGLTMYAEVRKDQDMPVVLSFEEPYTLIKTALPDEDNLHVWGVGFRRDAEDMDIPIGVYQMQLIVGTLPDFSDKTTIAKGEFNVVKEITQKPVHNG